MSEIITIPKAISTIDSFEQTITKLGEESPEKAYIIGNQIAKVAKGLQDRFKEGFQNYYDTNKELPGGFQGQIRGGRTTYDFSADPEWSELSAKLKAREEILKNATDQSIKGNLVLDEQGTVITAVPWTKGADTYAITSKK